MQNGNRRAGYWLLSALLGTCLAAADGAEARVEFELLTDAGTPVTAGQQWLAVLKDVGLAGVRIRAARAGDEAEIRQRGSERAPVFQVTGVLTGRNTLRLPGGEFRQSDKAGLKQWLAKLQEGGEAGLFEKPAAFGLTARQLVAVHDALSKPILFNTRGEKSSDVLRRIAGGLTLPLAADEAARPVLASDEVVADELQGLSAGTAMVVVLRPLGLILVPQKQPGGEARLWITDVRRSAVSWPVGWPPEKPPRELLPELFTFLNVEIQDTPLSEALDTIGKRLKTPILVDQNSLARQRIDLTQVKVSLPPGRTYYQRIIERLLYQAKLKMELRMDEAKKPFLWISTVKQSP
jgi:hypothetical protein